MVWHLILFGYIFGIAAGLFSDAPFFSGVCFVAGVSVLTVWIRERAARALALSLILAGVGYLQTHETVDGWRTIPSEYTVEGQATIVREPEIKERNQDAVVRFMRCSDGKCPMRSVLISVSPYEPLHYGDTIAVRCPLKIPKNIGTDFDYRMYLAMQGIGFVCYPESWRIDGEPSGNGFVRAVFHGRALAEANLDRVVVYPESGLGKGLLFGGNGYLTKETQNDFSRTGMSHIVAVSGANVVIVAECVFLLAIACGLWRKKALWTAFGGIVLFVIMVGAGASAVRAGVMGGMVLVASYSGRVSDGLRLWSLAMAAMLAFNPLLLRYDLGFQLSFAATLGILLCMPLFERLSEKHNWIPPVFKEILWMSLSAELFVLPIVFFNFHTFSTVSLLANALVLPVIPAAMLFGFLASLLGFLWLPIAKLFGTVAYLVLHYMLFVIGTLSAQSSASIPVVSFGLWAAFVWYFVLCAIVFILRKKYV